MIESGIPGEIRAFLRARIRSVGEIEVLLLLHRDPKRWWTPDQIYSELRTSLESARQCLRALKRNNLVQEVSGAESTYAFHAADADTDRIVSLLDALFHDRMASIVEVVYAPRHESIRAFADAFRITNAGDDDDERS